jgi:hypothetical protein
MLRLIQLLWLMMLLLLLLLLLELLLLFRCCCCCFGVTARLFTSPFGRTTIYVANAAADTATAVADTVDDVVAVVTVVSVVSVVSTQPIGTRLSTYLRTGMRPELLLYVFN